MLSLINFLIASKLKINFGLLVFLASKEHTQYNSHHESFFLSPQGVEGPLQIIRGSLFDLIAANLSFRGALCNVSL